MTTTPQPADSGDKYDRILASYYLHPDPKKFRETSDKIAGAVQDERKKVLERLKLTINDTLDHHDGQIWLKNIDMIIDAELALLEAEKDGGTL